MIELNGSDKSPVPGKAHLQVNSGLSELDQVLSWFSHLHQSPIPTSVWIRCQLALAEAFTNAVRHAHRELPPNASVDIEVTLLPEHLEIRVWDQGPPFDLEQKINSLSDRVDIFSPGGRGLKLMKDIADTLSYTRTDDNNRNCLLIVKQYCPTLEGDGEKATCQET